MAAPIPVANDSVETNQLLIGIRPLILPGFGQPRVPVLRLLDRALHHPGPDRVRGRVECVHQRPQQPDQPH